ncbi:tail fiber protein [Flavobacterium sp. TR2]|uniref:phage tail protein n=1 Tax=Flavobacterium sp. TR2 TaxID=2977321 RepID=UPI0021B128F7|nr:tail fiber protein [Flavobacterium sp. TR2]UWY27329.1 tail fiber protein [Flavobacterium sp. TR2]
MEVFLGTILGFGFNFPPRGWAYCNGQLISISQNTALFSLLGTMYGGDGMSTFGLPDLRGRAPIHFGQGPGLSNITQGERAGTENTTLTTLNIPAHIHALAGGTAAVTVTATTITGGTITNETDGGNNSFASSGSAPNIYSEPGGSGTDKVGGFSATATLGGNTAPTGGTSPFSIRNPYLAINFCIATSGIFPSRN